MNLKITKSAVCNSMDKMVEVATKAIKTDFELAGRVTIETKKDKVIFITSNGHTDARIVVDNSIDNNLEIGSQGKVTVDVKVLSGVVNALGGKDGDNHIFSLDLDDQVLIVKDTQAKSRKKVKLQTLSKDCKVDIKKPTKPLFSYEYETELFCKSVRLVSKYVSKLIYKAKYLMICLHFLKDEYRFVCGDGMRFAIQSFKEDLPNTDIKDDDGVKLLIPVDQINIVANVIADSHKVLILYRDEQTCYIQPDNNMELLVKGIPADSYIAYEKHAFQKDEAREVIDISKEDLIEGTALVAAVRDKQLESEGAFQTCHFEREVTDNVFFEVREKKYRCEFDCPAIQYPTTDGDSDPFKSMYAAQFLQEMAHASPLEHIRFYCISEEGTLIAQPVKLQSNKDENGMPTVEESEDGSELSFFFAAVTEDDDDGEED